MADQSQELNVTISAQDAGAIGTTSTVNDLLVAMEADLAKLNATGTATLEALTAGHQRAAGAATEHAAAETIAGEAIGKVETATNAAARALSAIGIESGAAAERVAGFAEAADGLGKAAPELLVLGAAVLVIAEGFNQLGEAIKDASDEQQSLIAIGQAVKNQGGDWATAQEGVEEFAKAIEETTAYSKGEALSAMRDLVTAGISVGDAERIIAVSTDVAAGSGRSLIDVTHLIIEAENGRGRALAELDPALRGVIKNHGDLNAILTILSENYGGQAKAALDTYAGSSKHLSNELEDARTAIGDKFLPALTAITVGLFEMTEMAEHDAGEVGAMFESFIQGSRMAGAAFVDFHVLAATALNPVNDFNGNTSKAFSQLQTDAQQATTSFKNIFSEIGDTYFADMLDGNVAKMTKELEERTEHAFNVVADARKRTLDSDPTMGTDPKDKQPKSPFDFEDAASDGSSSGTKAEDAAQKALNVTLREITDSEEAYKVAVTNATDAQAKKNAEMALARKVTADAKEEQALLTAAILHDIDANTALQAELPKQTAAYDAAKEAYESYGKALNGTDATPEQTRHLRDLKTAMDEAKKSVDDTTASISKNTDDVNANAAALAKLAPELNAITAEYAKQQKQLEDTLAAFDKSIAASAKEVEAEKERRALAVENLGVEESLYGLSIQQQLAYYQRRYAAEVAADQQYTDEGKATFDKILSLEQDEYKQRLDAENKYVEQVEASETTLLNDIIEKHQSFHSILHDIFQEVGDDFIKMVERMIVEAPLLTSVEKTLFNIMNPGGGGSPGGGNLFGGGNAGGISQAASLYGILGATTGESGANNVISQLDTTSVTSTFLGTGAAQQLSDSSINSFFEYGSSPGGPTDAGINAFVASNAPGGGASFLGSGLAGAGIGTAIGSLTGGNETGASIGGALGGIGGEIIGTLGGAAGGPLGAAIGSVVGSLLGSLIGGPTPTPANNPDEFESQTGYGQAIANLRGGQSGANGQAYFPSAAVEQFIEAMGVGNGTINGAPGEGQQMKGSTGAIGSSGGVDAAEIWLAQNQSDTAQQLESMGISPAQFANWEQIFGVSASGSGQFTQPNKNIGQVEVTGATSGGNTMTTYSALESALQAIIGAGGGSGTPVFSMTEAYPGAPSVLSSAPLGTYNSTTGAYTPSGASGGPQWAANQPGASSGAAGSAGGASVVVNVNGNLIGTGGIDSIVLQISQGLQKLQSGIIPGAPNTLRATRYGLS